MEAYLNMTNYTTVLENPNRYLSKHIVNKCFRKGKITTVDKVVAGNGFTTGFLNLPIEDGKVNIIIAPNKGVLMNKEDAINKNPGLYNNRVKFFYKESLETNFDNADVLFFVADSFLLKRKSINDISHKVDKVLIDENHSVEQQSLFRHFIKDLDRRVSNILNLEKENISVVKVTASPTHFANVDIRINNALISGCVINHTRDREKSLERIKTDLKANKNVVVFTNSSTLPYKLRNKKGVLKANYIVGDNMKRTMVELFVLEQNPESNLSIISSRGFEGIDIGYADAHVYFFEDRTSDYESFYVSNLYQAINRTRSGANYIEYCRQELNDKRKLPFNDFENTLNKFISNDFKDKDGKILSIEHKQRSDYKKFKPFLIFEQDSNGVFSVRRDEITIKLFKEKILYDAPFPAPEFKEFLDIRKITINKIEETQCRLSRKVKVKTKERNLFKNWFFIKYEGLFNDDYSIDLMDGYNAKISMEKQDFRKIYLKRLEGYFRRKNYDLSYTLSTREKNALNLLTDDSKFSKLVREMTKAYNDRSIEKYGRRKSEEYRKRFKNKAENTVGLLILAFANRKIYLPSKWVGNRDYNLLTSIGVSEIDLIADALNLNVLEIDAVSCYPRLVYALSGKILPDGFYGPNKKNKVGINVFINDFFYNPEKNTQKKQQKAVAKNTFINYGFDADVIDYLIDNFFESKNRGDLFSKISFHERRLISETKSKLQENGFDNCGIVRRHDSVLVFTEKTTPILDTITAAGFVDDMVFLYVDRWFNVMGKAGGKVNTEPISKQELIDRENDLIYAEWKRTKRDYAPVLAPEPEIVIIDNYIEDKQTYISF